jgi:hypothetical protein
MQKPINLLILIIILLLSGNCKQSKEEIVNFSSIDSLKTYHSFSLEKMNRYFLIDFYDSTLIIMNRNASSILSLYNRHNYNLIKETIKRGRGPKELISPIRLFVDHNEHNVNIYDAGKDKYFTFDSDSLVLKQHPEATRNVELPKHLAFNHHCFHLNKSGEYITMTTHKDSHFVYFNKAGKIIESNGTFPDKRKLKNISAPYYGSVWKGIYDINRTNSQIVKGYHYFNRISFYDLNGNEIKTYKLSNAEPEIIIRGKMPKTVGNYKIHYTKLYTTNNYIFTLYEGKTVLETANDYGYNGGNVLHVLDWNYKPIKKLWLEHRIADFCVDEKTKTIYGINYTHDKQVKIYKYNKL